MLPAELPRLRGLEAAARYSPARDGLDVGGDWYDVVALPDGTVGVCLGDVQGHDVAAAAVMGQIRSMMRACIELDPTPEAVLTRTNNLLAEMDSGLFASCTYLHLDPPTGRCVLGCAGHVAYVTTGHDGAADVREGPDGTVLGVLAGAAYSQEHFELAPGGMVVLVSDGVVEDRARGLDAGFDALRAALDDMRGEPVHDIADRVIAAAAEHGNADDDAAVVVLRRSPAP